jgi:hypothetical protein
MSFYDYRASKEIAAKDWPFRALIMAAMRKADGDNLSLLIGCWPEAWSELRQRYDAPGGILQGEDGARE